METLTKVCRNCGKQFNKPPKSSLLQWSRRFCCSVECGNSSKETSWLVKYQIKKGQVLSPGTVFKKGQTAGEKNVNWKGRGASYVSKHMWMSYHFGTPMYCEHCNTTKKRMYHWANVSGEYKREKSDWLRLCVPCHKRYDLDSKHAV